MLPICSLCEHHQILPDFFTTKALHFRRCKITQSHLLVSRLDPDPAAVVQKKGSSNLASAEYSQLHPRTAKQHIPMVSRKMTSKSGFNWYVGRNFGLELINFLPQGRSKVRKEDMEAKYALPELCFGSVSHLGPRGHSRRKVSDEQDTGTRLGELGADTEWESTGRGDDCGEEISRRGELCVPKYGNYRTGQL